MSAREADSVEQIGVLARHLGVAVGTALASGPGRGSGLALLVHPALTLDKDAKALFRPRVQKVLPSSVVAEMELKPFGAICYSRTRDQRFPFEQNLA